MNRRLLWMPVLLVAIAALLMVNLLIGTIDIGAGEILSILTGKKEETPEGIIHYNIIWKSRLPQTITALVAGAGLSVSGLQMQTVFRNPLAGPSVLGISNGAALGVAFVVLMSGQIGGTALSQLGLMGDAALSIAAVVGALAVLGLIAWVSGKVQSSVTLLIIGVMIGYLATAIISVLKFFSIEEDVHAYVIWGLGSFARVSAGQVWLFTAIMAVLLPLSMLLVKQMNLMLLGDRYARNLGLNIRRSRLLVILSSGTLVAIVAGSTFGPRVFGSISTPAFFVSSFSGMRPQDRTSVSQSKCVSVPGMGFRLSSTFATLTPVTCSRPSTSVTVCDRRSGMS